MNEVKLVSPTGNRVRVTPERAAELAVKGYRSADIPTESVDLTPKPRKRAPRKAAGDE